MVQKDEFVREDNLFNFYVKKKDEINRKMYIIPNKSPAIIIIYKL